MSGELASDVNNPQFVGASDPDSVMVAKFYVRAIPNNWKSGEEGRPIFEDRVYCEYFAQGNRLSVMDVPATDFHKQRFPRQWQHFKNGLPGEVRETGTPLAQWPLLTVSTIQELNALKFYTIDGIASASDEQLSILGMGFAGMGPHVLRTKAKAFLQAAKDSAFPQRQAQELEAVKAQIAAKDKQLEELTAMVKGLMEKPKQKGWPKGKPRKAKDQPLNQVKEDGTNTPTAS